MTDTTTSERQHPVQVTDVTFDATVLKSQQPVLVDFWAEWCGPCRMLTPTLEELAGKYAGKITIGKVNVDENPSTAASYNIRSIPAILVFKAGQVVETLIGVQPKASYERVIDRLVDQA